LIVLIVPKNIPYKNQEIIELALKESGITYEDSPSILCCMCKKSTEPLINHHIKYKPEIIIRICQPCHYKIHHANWGVDYEYEEGKDYSSPYRKYIWYTPNERNEHYKKQVKLVTKQTRIELVCPKCHYVTKIDYERFHRCVNCGWIPELAKLVL